MSANERTLEQIGIALKLSSQFGIDPERVFFPDPTAPKKPWLGADELTSIARQSDQFQAIEERFESCIVALNQIVHSARVIDKQGRVFERCGIATLGESLQNAKEVDEHQLAGSRAVVAALTTAGFNPLRGAGDDQKPFDAKRITFADEASVRQSQLREIHSLAEELGLIIPRGSGMPRDTSKYKAFLRDNYGVESVAGMNESERASVIAALDVMKREYGDL